MTYFHIKYLFSISYIFLCSIFFYINRFFSDFIYIPTTPKILNTRLTMINEIITLFILDIWKYILSATQELQKILHL